jgi:GNAT superfamily N-acetyltransferase
MLDSRTHALDFQRKLDIALSTRVEPTASGMAIFRDDLQRVTDLNFLLVEGAPPGIRGSALMAEAELLQAGLPHRAVRVDDPAVAVAVAPRFAAAGWTVERTALMMQRGVPDRPIDASTIEEVDLERVRAAREAAIRHEERDLDIAAEVVALGELQDGAIPVRAFAALLGADVAAYCLLRIGEGSAKLVEVQALARSQGHGVGRAAIWAAVTAARRERATPIFVECEDEEWAKSLYRRLGFRDLGPLHRFVRHWGDDDLMPLAI